MKFDKNIFYCESNNVLFYVDICVKIYLWSLLVFFKKEFICIGVYFYLFVDKFDFGWVEMWIIFIDK